MPLPESIRRAWSETDYRVRLAAGGFTSIRCGQALPAPLVRLLSRPDAPWGFITAWNPASVLLPPATNRVRQRRLRDELKADRYCIYCGTGVGTGDWRERSLFVPDINHAKLDDMARQFGQLSVVRGVGDGPAELHELM
jgi:hypothetical protein